MTNAEYRDVLRAAARLVQRQLGELEALGHVESGTILPHTLTELADRARRAAA